MILIMILHARQIRIPASQHREGAAVTTSSGNTFVHCSLCDHYLHHHHHQQHIPDRHQHHPNHCTMGKLQWGDWIFSSFVKYLFLIFVFIWVFGELRQLCAKFGTFWAKIHREMIRQS